MQHISLSQRATKDDMDGLKGDMDAMNVKLEGLTKLLQERLLDGDKVMFNMNFVIIAYIIFMKMYTVQSIKAFYPLPHSA